MPGIKHLIECHCSLIIFKNNDKQIYHKFPVYSIIDKNQNQAYRFNLFFAKSKLSLIEI